VNDAYTCHEWNFNHNGLTNEVSRPNTFGGNLMFIIMIIVCFTIILIGIFKRHYFVNVNS